MTNGSVDRSTGTSLAPILVVGLGNPLLADDGLGLRLLSMLADSEKHPVTLVEYLDGGTQGIALLGRLGGREAILFLDAISRGDPPGTVHRLDATQIFGLGKKAINTAHEGGVAEILRTMTLTNDVPKHVAAIGIEPKVLSSRVGLSPRVESSLPAALDQSRTALLDLIAWHEGERR